MSGPKFRFTVVVSFLVISVWLYLMVSSYLFGERGLNFERYGQGVAMLLTAALCGFVIVWLSLKGIEMAIKRQKTGFEGEFTDEYGTTFRMRGIDGKPEPFAFSLSKFLPQFIAPPTDRPDLHPLEAELIGFLNGYRHWPYDLERQDISLYDAAMAEWTAMHSLPGTTWLHRVAALAQNLGKIHAYQEDRQVFPINQWWKRDRVRFVRRCREHGGLAGVVLATMPHFREIASDPAEAKRLRNVLLTALKYRLDALNLPLNTDPMAREIVDALHRAHTLAKQTTLGDMALLQTDAELLVDLKKQLKDYLSALIEDVAFGADPALEGTAAIGLGNGLVAMRQNVLLERLARLMPPSLREALHLWESGGGTQHPAWPSLATVLADLNILTLTYDHVPGSNGVFTLHFGHDTVWPDACLLHYDALQYPGVAQRLTEVPTWKDGWFVSPNASLIPVLLKDQAGRFEELTASLLQ